MLVSMFKVDKELTTTTTAPAAKITMAHNIEKKNTQKVAKKKKLLFLMLRLIP